MSLTQTAVYQHGQARSRWSVYYYRKGKWRRKRFKEDFTAALKFYTENVETTGLTLHCDNVAFPPPDRIRFHERESWEIVTRKGKKYKKRKVTVVNLMEDYNRKGIWWCGYCIKLRRFKEIQTDRGTEMCCPVCWVSNYMVRDHNPFATVIEYHKTQRRTPGARKKRKRRG